LRAAEALDRIAEIRRGRQSFERLRINFVIAIQREALDFIGAVELQLLIGRIATPAAEGCCDHRSGVCVDRKHVRAENSRDE